MTDIEIHTRTGKRMRLAAFSREVGAKDKLALAVVLRDWCEKDGRWKPHEVVLKTWVQSKGWVQFVAD